MPKSKQLQTPKLTAPFWPIRPTVLAVDFSVQVLFVAFFSSIISLLTVPRSVFVCSHVVIRCLIVDCSSFSVSFFYLSSGLTVDCSLFSVSLFICCHQVSHC